MIKLILSVVLALGVVGCCSTCETDVQSQEKYAVAFFNATWCNPCVRMKADVWDDKEVQSELKKYGVDFYSIDVDQNPNELRTWNVTSFPTTILLKSVKNGDNNQWVEVGRLVGYRSKAQLKQLLDRLS